MSCKKYSNKVPKKKCKFYCDRCIKYDNSVNQQYMLKVEVFDESSTGHVSLWDRKVVELNGNKAAEIKMAHEYAKDMPIEILEKLLGKIALFRIQIRKEPTAAGGVGYNCNKVCVDPNIQNFKRVYSLLSLGPCQTQVSDGSFLSTKAISYGFSGNEIG